MSMRINVAENRARSDWRLQIQIARVLWGLCLPLFRLSPRIFWQWRVWLLRCFGAEIGRDVRLHPTVRIMMPWHLQIGDQAAVGDGAILYALAHITIGHRSTVSQYAHLCTGSHDRNDPTRPLIRRPITIGDDAWICADAFVGPGVHVGHAAVLGARAVAMRDVPDGKIGVGNPLQIKEAL